MIVVIAIAIMMMLVLLIISRNEEIPDKCKESKITIPFYRLGAYIFRRTFDRDDNFYYRKIFDKNSLIYAAKENREITSNYFIEKLGICVLAIFVGLIFVLIIGIRDLDKSEIKENNQIARNAYNKGEKTIVLDATVDKEKLNDIELQISEIKYTAEEFGNLVTELMPSIEEEFLGENESPDFVNKNLNLIDSVTGYPFLIEWKILNKEYIDFEGKIRDGVPKEGALVNVRMVISYEEYSREDEFAIQLFPKEMTKKELLISKINALVSESNSHTRNEADFTLPSSVDGIEIVWKEKKSKNMIVFLMLLLATTLGIFFGKDMDLDKQIQNRNRQMMDDYAEIISKLTLYVGAGMSVALAWKKIVNDYQYKKSEGMPVHFAYEEMTYAMYEMETGVEESKCYQHFANRVKVQKYVKMVSLLEQNMKMGSKGMLEDLRAEANDAFQERKSMAEKKGEESATKLMLPMFMMLLIVMVVIMVPAFMSM